MQDAKTHFSALLDRAAAGEEMAEDFDEELPEDFLSTTGEP